jgi:hypothetical protein
MFSSGKPVNRRSKPYTPAYRAGHSHFATTKRYVHPQVETVREAIAVKARPPVLNAA